MRNPYSQEPKNPYSQEPLQPSCLGKNNNKATEPKNSKQETQQKPQDRQDTEQRDNIKTQKANQQEAHNEE